MFLAPELNSFGAHFTDVVVKRTTRLDSKEISRLSRCMGVDWDSLAGLMDIPYEEREEIRTKYSDCSSKTRAILSIFNESKGFCRNLLKKYLVEIRRDDVTGKMKVWYLFSYKTSVNTNYDLSEIMMKHDVLGFSNISSRFRNIQVFETCKLDTVWCHLFRQK